MEEELLILSRKPGEIIRINHDISFQILRIEGRQVKIGIEAPPEYNVHRQEIYMLIHYGIKNETNR